MQRCTGTPLHTAAIAFSSPGRAIDDEEFGPPQATLDEVVEHCPRGLMLPPPTLLFASSIFWPSAHTIRRYLEPDSETTEDALRSVFLHDNRLSSPGVRRRIQMQLMFGSSSRS